MVGLLVSVVATEGEAEALLAEYGGDSEEGDED